MLGAICIPKGETSIHLAVVDLVVEGRVVASVLVYLARKQKRSVETGIENLLHIRRGINLKTGKHSLPLALCGGDDIIERTASDFFFEISLRLFL